MITLSSRGSHYKCILEKPRRGTNTILITNDLNKSEYAANAVGNKRKGKHKNDDRNVADRGRKRGNRGGGE